MSLIDRKDRTHVAQIGDFTLREAETSEHLNGVLPEARTAALPARDSRRSLSSRHRSLRSQERRTRQSRGTRRMCCRGITRAADCAIATGPYPAPQDRVRETPLR